MGSLEKALVPLLVGSLGVGVAWLLTGEARGLVLVIGGFVAVLGFLLKALATRVLPARPLVSRSLFESSLLGQATVAVYAAGFLVWFAVASDVPQGASTFTKKAVAALAAAITAAVTAAFVKDAGNADDTWVARSMKASFRKAYSDSAFALPEPSRSRVHSDVYGWTRAERKEIATEVQATVDAKATRESATPGSSDGPSDTLSG